MDHETKIGKFTISTEDGKVYVNDRINTIVLTAVEAVNVGTMIASYGVVVNGGLPPKPEWLKSA